MATPSSAAELLEHVPPAHEVAYLVGPRPAQGWRRWAADTGATDWVVDHLYLDANMPVVRYRNGRRRLEVHPAGAWFGDGPYSVEAARCAWSMMRYRIGQAFDGATLLATPATTGRELWRRTIPRGREWPVLDDELQMVIRSTSGQGRIELLPPTRLSPDHPYNTALGRLVEYDGRMMYGALCWGLATGTPARVTRDVGTLDLYAAGRYRVRVTIPRDWHGRFGLVGVMDDSAEGWRWPRAPGETFETWCDAAEWFVMVREGWETALLEGWTWPRDTRKGPLDVWASRLCGIAGELEAATYCSCLACSARRLARQGVRAIVLHAIGAFHGRAHRITRMVPTSDADKVPPDAARTMRVDGDMIVWHEDRGQSWPELAHPEWSAQIWGRARARLLRAPVGGALAVRPDDVVAFRTDALYLASDPEWPDDGRVGRYRKVRDVDGPMPYPVSHAHLLELRGGVR